jgi:tight adherence protein C
VYDTLLALTEPQNLVAIFTAFAVFATILTLAMPAFQQNEIEKRVQSAVIERDKIRQRERERLANERKQASLKNNDDGLAKEVAEAFNLKKALADEATFANLRMAGYRKQSHVYVFLVFRLILPFILLAIAAVYVFLLADLDYPFMVKLTIVLAVGFAGFYAPNIFIANQLQKRQLSMRRALPDAMDLLLICIESGMSIEAGFRKVAIEIGSQSPPLAEELILTTAELSYLQERRKAYENLVSRTGLEPIKALTMALIQGERYGTSLGTALRALSQENRDLRMAEAEKKAAALPPKLTVPMIVFFLPVLVGVIMGPALIQVFETDW